ncbi:MAG: FAD binding domain-containing protein [Halovenus sp.]
MVASTEYHRPTSVESACQLLSELEDPTIVAGMQSLGLLVKEGIVSPDVLVDINQVEGLAGIERDGDRLHVGATTSHRAVETSETVAETVPVLGTAAGEIADLQIRNAGTIGGATVYADPTGDYPPVLLAVDATLVSRSVDGEHERDAVDFFTGFYECALEPTELLTSVRLPVMDDSEGAGYEKLAYRENDRSVVNVCSYVRVTDGVCEAARIAVGSVSGKPLYAADAAETLVGTTLDGSDIEAAAETAAEEIPVDPDPTISDDYREAMVGSLTENTLRDAREEVSE